jgi:GAF domain-containing protein
VEDFSLSNVKIPPFEQLFARVNVIAFDIHRFFIMLKNRLCAVVLSSSLPVYSRVLQRESLENNEVRLVASYEDPTIRNLVVDLNRYPELKRAFDSGETVFIPDATSDPSLHAIKETLDTRNVRSIIVVPIHWQGIVIGAIFLRTDRDAQPFSDGDVRFCQVVASLTAKALRNAHRFEALLRGQQDASQGQHRAELQRVALIAFLRRLLQAYTKSDDHVWAETLLPKASDEELERLVMVALQVIDEESKS